MLAARVDSYHNAESDGSEGQRLRRLVCEKIDKWQEPPKAKTKKALPIPEEKKKSRRGGKRVRRWKERFAMTEVRQQQNRIKVSTNEGEYGDSAMGRDLGMLSSSENTGSALDEVNCYNTYFRKAPRSCEEGNQTSSEEAEGGRRELWRHEWPVLISCFYTSARVRASES